MNNIETSVTRDQLNCKVDKIDKGTLIVTQTSSEESMQLEGGVINKINNRIDHLERKILKQENVFKSIDPILKLASSDDKSGKVVKKTSNKTNNRQTCTFIEQYSHVPETSAFQRYAQQPAPLSPSKATTIEKEHNSEQYGRDFTTYDGITARGRRQCASVPLRRDDIPKLAAERVHKIRHKLNPVRDYRLMDTVHYLAQGEFAPRDDGIKLTPSREAVLSDIIWEDVCRTHWPNTRLSRRVTQRHNAHSELQRLIDNLLRERIAHVERRRRRHYKIIKLNHRHDNCRPVGKTGDIIVASHKNKQLKDDLNYRSNHHATAMTSGEYWLGAGKNEHRIEDNIAYQNIKDRHTTHYYDETECVPGPSHILPNSTKRKETYYCQTVNPRRIKATSTEKNVQPSLQNNASSISFIKSKKFNIKNPRFLVKKQSSRRKQNNIDDVDLEHFILLPTLVVRTPSNVKRQKKFNDLYRRILNAHTQRINNSRTHKSTTEKCHQRSKVKTNSSKYNVTTSGGSIEEKSCKKS